MARSKWDILVARRVELQKQLDQANRHLKGLKETPCGIDCSGCHEFFETEADFAKHFVIGDERYLNLGECPNDPALAEKLRHVRY